MPYPNGATAIGDALQLAARNLPPKGNRVIILITDGVNNAGADPSEIAQYLGAHHIPIFTIGIGTNSGEIIPGTNQEATIDEDALRSYAQASGGAYARVESASQLRDALGRLGRITTLERKHVDASLEFAIARSARHDRRILCRLRPRTVSMREAPMEPFAPDPLRCCSDGSTMRSKPA